ncbi:hypothetical protein [Streptomyces sp. ALI-76-A]|uniref:hypothetical protein n=1 Tax=Streptomyces sp. ALI-76-A TaxID=3025736 RepID=UPI00256F2570|nr:hypothetical protein [Streptomyces sp. ALI-76-A]MDL5201258.1 hypothetical protein [Streptomyces sp. ALI-76-A]
MTPAPTLATERHGGTLVVFEGSRRLLWSRPEPGRWRPVGIWPGADEAAALAAHLAARRNVLVVLDATGHTVSLLAEELAAAPASVRRLVPGPDPYPDEPVDVRIPVLDWLPAPLRRPGVDFLRTGAELVRRTPAALLPPLLTDAFDPARPHLRFALRTQRHGIGGGRLADTVGHLFGR